MEKLPNIIPGIGGPDAIEPISPKQNLMLSSKPTEEMITAAETANKLFDWCLMPDVADPEAYLVGAAAIIGEYPQGVCDAIADPRTGTRVLKDRPTLSQIRRACDVL